MQINELVLCCFMVSFIDDMCRRVVNIIVYFDLLDKLVFFIKMRCHCRSEKNKSTLSMGFVMLLDIHVRYNDRTL